MDQILQNKIQTPDGTILQSFDRHDFKTYKDKNGYKYMVDGGIAYLRRSIVKEAPYIELSVFATGNHEIDRQYLLWGTYGKAGDQPLKYKVLSELSNDHVKALKDTQKHAHEFYRKAFSLELEFRDKNKILIKD